MASSFDCAQGDNSRSPFDSAMDEVGRIAGILPYGMSCFDCAQHDMCRNRRGFDLRCETRTNVRATLVRTRSVIVSLNRLCLKPADT